MVRCFGRWVYLSLALTAFLVSACGDGGRVAYFDGPSGTAQGQGSLSQDGTVPISRDTDDVLGQLAISSVEVSSLRVMAVDRVNERRRELGRPPLTIGDSVAAQLAAEESLANFALLEYTQDGLPIEALYTATGGRGSILSSGQIRGYLDAASVHQCRSALVVCRRTNAAGDLSAYVDSLLDEASPHDRESLLFPDWETLHVGVAYTDFTLVVVLQVGHQEVTYVKEPSVSGGFLSVELAPDDGVEVESVVIYYYPKPPSPATPLVRTKVLSIHQPPDSGQVLALPDEGIVADYWSTEGLVTSIVASIVGRVPGLGVYEVVVWTGASLPASQYFLNLDNATMLQPDPTRTPNTESEASTIEELRVIALDLINADRRSYGAPPVRLGTNQAAQLHAEDSVRSGYLAGHWTSEGMKPYMLYTQAGGVGVIAENAAGQTTGSDNCDKPTVICGEIDVVSAIEALEWSMMYDDEHADWGHRDTIVNPIYDTVNIGIAFTDTHVAYYQHFEYTRLTHEAIPTIQDGILRLWLKPMTGLEIGPIAVYYDPPPTPKRPEEISRLTAYCPGGGFTDNCDTIEPIAQVLKPPPAGSHYVDREPEQVVAQLWNLDDNGIVTIEANLRQRIAANGVYTIVIFSDVGHPGPLAMYSISQ